MAERSMVEKVASAIEDACGDAEQESIPGSYIPKTAWPTIARAAIKAHVERGSVMSDDHLTVMRGMVRHQNWYGDPWWRRVAKTWLRRVRWFVGLELPR